MNVAMAIMCGISFLAAIFFFFCTLGSLFYPQSRTTVEVYPTDVRTPRRWKPTFLHLALTVSCAGVSATILETVFMPEISAKVRDTQLTEAEEVTYHTFFLKQQRKPAEVTFEDDPRNSIQKVFRLGWELKGTATFENGEVWDLNVSKTGDDLQCAAQCRQ